MLEEDAALPADLPPCAVCRSTDFERAGDGTLICRDCGTCVKGVFEEQLDANDRVSSGRVLHRAKRARLDEERTAAPRKRSAARAERPRRRLMLEAFQALLLDLVVPAATLSGGDWPKLNADVRAVWLRCVPLLRVATAPEESPDGEMKMCGRAGPSDAGDDVDAFSEMAEAHLDQRALGLPYFRDFPLGVRGKRLTLNLTPKVALALLLAGCMQGRRAVVAEDLIRWIQNGDLPIFSAHRRLQPRFKPILDWTPFLVKLFILPSTKDVHRLALALQRVLDFSAKVPPLPAVMARIAEPVRLPASLQVLALRLYRRAMGEWEGHAASMEANSSVLKMSMPKIRSNHNVSWPRYAREMPAGHEDTAAMWWRDAAAALLFAAKLACNLESPPQPRPSPDSRPPPHSDSQPAGSGVGTETLGETASAGKFAAIVSANRDSDTVGDRADGEDESANPNHGDVTGPCHDQQDRGSQCRGDGDGTVGSSSLSTTSADPVVVGEALWKWIQPGLLSVVDGIPGRIAGSSSLAASGAQPGLPWGVEQALLLDERDLPAYLAFCEAHMFAARDANAGVDLRKDMRYFRRLLSDVAETSPSDRGVTLRKPGHEATAHVRSTHCAALLQRVRDACLPFYVVEEDAEGATPRFRLLLRALATVAHTDHLDVQRVELSMERALFGIPAIRQATQLARDRPSRPRQQSSHNADGDAACAPLMVWAMAESEKERWPATNGRALKTVVRSVRLKLSKQRHNVA